MEIVDDKVVRLCPPSMRVTQMGVVGCKVAVIVSQTVGIGARPQPKRRGCSECGEPGHCGESSCLTHLRAELSDERVADQPSAMAQRKLRREQRRPILGVR